MINHKNKIQLIGIVDIPIIDFKNAVKISQFKIATKEKYTSTAGVIKTQTFWHHSYATGKLAETIEKYFSEGMEVAVEGFLIQAEDEHNGTNITKTLIHVTDLLMLTRTCR